MKYIFVNLKRFDVPPELNGINRLAEPANWARAIVGSVCNGLKKYTADDDPKKKAAFTFFFPEAHAAIGFGNTGHCFHYFFTFREQPQFFR